MKQLVIFSTLVLAASVCGAGERVSLFNGKDLTGWTAVVDYNVTGGYAASEPTWFVADGAIRTTGTPYGYLRTKRGDYGDFRLHVEYRWWRPTAKPNSGVFVRIAGEHGSFIPTAIENQLCRGSAGDVLGLGGFRFAGRAPRNAFDATIPLSGITKVLRPGADVEKPFGEWNTIEVELKGDTIVNTVNGMELNRVSGLSVPKGAIGLQSEGGAAEFRNVWIEEASAPACDGAGAAELKNGAEFTLADAPEELTVHLKRGGAVRFLVEENGTTGYQWEATYARNECTVEIEHRGAAAKGLCGAPGKAAFTVTKNAAVQSPSLVEFAYRRNWEKDVKPAKVVRLVLYTIPGSDVDFRYPASRTLHMLKADR